MELNPSQIYSLADQAYESRENTLGNFKDKVKYALPFVDKDSVKLITATSGLISTLPHAPSWL
ncbi:MAG TPA: hypothetical protein VFV43_03460 [Limnobacter sp.]|nr:hypothetical protein [Limnobacter sp.]